MKKLLLIFFVLISIVSCAQNPLYLNRFIRLNGGLIQIDSLRNGVWKTIATQAYVQGYVANHGGGGGSVSSVFGRTGSVSAVESDYQTYYPRFSQSYSNPSWITALAQSKITFSGSSLQYQRADGSFANFPTLVSSFINDLNFISESDIPNFSFSVIDPIKVVDGGANVDSLFMDSASSSLPGYVTRYRFDKWNANTGVTDGDKGDLTIASGVYTIDNNAITTAKITDANVTKAKMVNLAAGAVFGNNTTASSVPLEVNVPVQIINTTATSVASININLSTYTSTYSSFTIEIEQILPATDNVDLWCRLSSDGTTFASGASNYQWNYLYSNSNNGSGAGGVGNTDTKILMGNVIDNGSTNHDRAEISIFNAASTTFQPTIRFWFQYKDNTSFSASTSGSGTRLNAQAVNGIQFLFSSGNIASIKYKVTASK
jgi:hypothetical protein